jgi:hypothetical protein
MIHAVLWVAGIDYQGGDHRCAFGAGVDVAVLEK